MYLDIYLIYMLNDKVVILGLDQLAQTSKYRIFMHIQLQKSFST